MTPTSAPRGTAAQRTQLAWNRTTLTLATAGLTIARLLWPESSPLALVVVAVSLAIAAVLVGLTAAQDRALSRQDATGPDGVLLAVVAAGTGTVGLAALALVAVR
jgi:uncharacterized membrane protein YidH (DUF202 family)